VRQSKQQTVISNQQSAISKRQAAIKKGGQSLFLIRHGGTSFDLASIC